jgi:hypothetical protein
MVEGTAAIATATTTLVKDGEEMEGTVRSIVTPLGLRPTASGTIPTQVKDGAGTQRQA